MNVFSAVVVFMMIWAMVFLLGLQVGQRTQGDAGETTLGTHDSTPAAPIRVWRRIAWATGITFVLWAPLIWFIASGNLTIDDLRRWTGREVWQG
jgi:predicted secreted protein